jgi:heat shock protein HslJ
MNRALPIAATALLVAACAAPRAGESAAEPVRFVCERGTSLAVTFLPGKAEVETPSGRLEMTQQPAASGFLYSNGGESIRGKGAELTWTRADGSAIDCRDEKSAMRQPQVEPPVPALGGSSWTLVRFQSSDDAVGSMVPPNVERYTLAFEPDGALALQLDCNRARGQWRATPSSPESGALELTGGAMTRAMCQPGAMDTQIARDLGRIRSYTFRGGHLFLALEADGGTYEFEAM